MTSKAIVGVFLGGKNLAAGKVVDNQLTNKTHLKINNKESEELVISEVIRSIKAVIDQNVIGIGIGVPSLVDTKQGIVYNAVNIPSWREVHLKEILEDHFKVPVYVNNDANCFAIGEKYFGKGRDRENIVGVILGAGIGAGVIFNGHLYSGSNCGAGEIGCFPYRDHDFEHYLCDSYFEVKYGIKADMLIQRAEFKDKIALAIFEQYGFDLGNLMKTILYAYDPDTIILGGHLAKAFPYFQKNMLKKVKSFRYSNSLKNLRIEMSENPDIAVLGAAALYFDAHNSTLIK